MQIGPVQPQRDVLERDVRRALGSSRSPSFTVEHGSLEPVVHPLPRHRLQRERQPERRRAHADRQFDRHRVARDPDLQVRPERRRFEQDRGVALGRDPSTSSTTRSSSTSAPAASAATPTRRPPTATTRSTSSCRTARPPCTISTGCWAMSTGDGIVDQNDLNEIAAEHQRDVADGLDAALAPTSPAPAPSRRST